MNGLSVEDSPLERGGLVAAFLLVMRGLRGWFPLLRGDKGVCYGEGRGIGGGITGSLFWCCEVVSVGLQWMLLILGSCAQALHTPGPSREGRFGRLFLVGNE